MRPHRNAHCVQSADCKAHSTHSLSSLPSSLSTSLNHHLSFHSISLKSLSASLSHSQPLSASPNLSQPLSTSLTQPLSTTLDGALSLDSPLSRPPLTSLSVWPLCHRLSQTDIVRHTLADGPADCSLSPPIAWGPSRAN